MVTGVKMESKDDLLNHLQFHGNVLGYLQMMREHLMEAK